MSNKDAQKQEGGAFDYHRVREWMLSPNRKRANMAFTAGAERNVAYLIEDYDAQKQEGDDYSAWLIERRDNNGKPTWLCSAHLPEFTDNAWEALHFGRRSDAEAFADNDGCDYTLYITEHKFPAPRKAKPTPTRAEVVEMVAQSIKNAPLDCANYAIDTDKAAVCVINTLADAGLLVGLGE